MRAPRLARWLLGTASGEAERSFLLADLEEELREVARDRGWLRARAWYWSQALRSIGPLLRRRLGGSFPFTRRARQDSAAEPRDPSGDGLPGGRRHRFGGGGGWHPADVAIDVRYAARSLRKAPGFTAVAVLALALGMGANTAIFSVVDGVLLDPLPWPEAERLVTITVAHELFSGAEMSVGSDRLAVLRREIEAVEGLTGHAGDSVHLAGEPGGGEPERLQSVTVLPGYLALLGNQPALGRGFVPEEFEPGQAPVVLLTHGLWQRRYGSDPAMVGSTVHLDDEPHTVVGILPRHADFPLIDPQVLRPAALPPDGKRPDGHPAAWFRLFARLADGATPEQARQQAQAAIEQFERQHPGGMSGWAARVRGVRERIVGAVDEPLRMLLGAVGFVLLIACANVANLLLARGVARDRELAVRAALGASRGRIARQLVVEALLLSLVAGALGVVLALWGTDALLALAPADLPRAEAVGISLRVLAFAGLLAVATGVGFGLVPAVGLSRGGLGRRLSGGGGGRGAVSGDGGRRLRDLLTVAEVALALVLLVGAGLMLRSLDKLSSLDPGFRPDGVLAVQVILPEYRYPEFVERRLLLERIVADVRAIPGVDEAAATSWLPLSGSWGKAQYWADGWAEEDLPWAYNVSVTPGYFEAMGIPVVRGRAFLPSDRADGAPVALVSEALARRSWPGEDPLGKRIELGSSDSPRPSDDAHTVVGVVGDVRPSDVRDEDTAAVYMPFTQSGHATVLQLVVKSDGDPLAVAGAVERAVRALAPVAPVENVQPLDQLLGHHFAAPRFYGLLLGLFAAVAAVLAATGVYGVISYAVARRVREIGVRVALGADARRILVLVLRQGMARVGLGAALGLGLALALSRWVSSLLYGVTPFDAPTYVGVAAAVLGVGLVATLLPAVRALRIDPLVALRGE